MGSGYIAVELAGVLQALGSDVDLFIRGDLPLRTMEPDVVSLLVDEMAAVGVTWVKVGMMEVARLGLRGA